MGPCRPRHDDRKGEDKYPGPPRFTGCQGCNLRKQSSRSGLPSLKDRGTTGFVRPFSLRLFRIRRAELVASPCTRPTFSLACEFQVQQRGHYRLKERARVPR
jgi:hypothetical protein